LHYAVSKLYTTLKPFTKHIVTATPSNLSTHYE